MSQISDEELLTKAYTATKNSYVPYSNFPVGTALLLGDGTMAIGYNVENAFYELTDRVERTAMFRAAAEHGGDHKIAACAIAGRKTIPCHPCGAYRQVLHEFGYKHVTVESERPTNDGLGAPTSINFEKILPCTFGPEDL